MNPHTASVRTTSADQNDPWTIHDSGNQYGFGGWGRYGSISSGVSNVLKFAVAATKVQPNNIPPSFGAITETTVNGAIEREYLQGDRARDRDRDSGVPLPQATGDPPITYSFVPPLPVGLTFADSRRITGTPSVRGASLHRYIATDGDGESSTLSVMLRIIIDTQEELFEAFTENMFLPPTDSNRGLSSDVGFFTNIVIGRNHPDHTSTNPQQNRGLIARQDGTDIVVEIEPVRKGFSDGTPADTATGTRSTIGSNTKVLYEVFVQSGIQDTSPIVGGPRYFSATGPDGAPDFEHPRGNPLDAASNTNDYEVIVTAASGAGDRAMQSTQTVTVNVTDVNDAPVLAPIAPPAFTAGTAGAFTITATDEDIPVQTLTFTLTGSDMFGAAITAGGEFSWTPGAGDVGVERMFTVEVADSANTGANQ